ncbi:MAG: Pls/PosA family non-ribosomal peptide synthetase [Pseudonocardiaceae bacterium]
MASPSDRVLVAAGCAQQPRTARGERLDHVFEERCDRIREYGRLDHLAVHSEGLALTFDELDRRANQLARYLLARGAHAGDRIALLFDQPVQSYIGMLAVMKINAAYLPLDVAFPFDRMSYIVSDARARMVLSLATVRDKVEGLGRLGPEVVWIDEAGELIAGQDPSRLTNAERGDPVDELAYIIYTSGSTGRPKGVAIDHPSICNFVRVAAEVYGIRAQDRVYQGMTIAFDFSVEEIWVPWMAGATLVPKPAGSSLLGHELHEFLVQRRITALCCVPTVLATLEEELPELRFLLVSGEACPQDLIARWYQPDRRFLNVYGPTEATVTATWTALHPDRPVTIGVPLPTYSAVILDPDDPYRALPRGEIGEIGIAGIGLAAGYINRADLTEKAFIPDFLGIPGNPSGRIYRTGDLGRINSDGEIEYHGRIDLQVKVRGYRIELTEIESVLLQVPGIAAAVVDIYRPDPDTVELVGYYSLRRDAVAVDPGMIYAELREQLPAYMVPAYLEQLDVIPLTTNDKADRKTLPAPTTRRVAASGDFVAPATATEEVLVEVLAQILGVETVSVTSHFFDELGANSLLMTQFSARVRRRTDLSISIKDIYQNPTVRKLGNVLGDAVPSRRSAATAPVIRTSGVGHVLTGVAQLLLLVAGAYLGGLLLDRAYRWASGGADWWEIYQRVAMFGAATFVGFCTLPILAKWLLIGRWKPTEVRLWSPTYFRFWLVKVLIRLNPMVLFTGSPCYILYLRALGAKIGKNAVILSRAVPVATDLITIGDRTVIRPGCSFAGYRAVAGRLQIGPVTLGADVLVGQNTVLDIGTRMGDGAQLGHSSSLHTGQSVPAGHSWHGSPAQPGRANYRTVAPARCDTVRKLGYSLLQLFGVFVLGSVGFTGVVLGLTRIPPLVALIGQGAPFLGRSNFYLVVALVAVGLVLALLPVALAVMMTVPRLLKPFITPGRVYPLYGLHHIAQQLITGLSNSSFFVLLLGDSSFIVHLVRGLGYDLSKVEQTGSNFGTQLHHDSPFLTTVGTGTMVCDGLSMMNTDFSNTSFRVNPVRIGERNFVGNDVAFPARARTGDNCLLATKVMVPIDGPVRHDVGLLGSPPFEIPRTAIRGTAADYPHTPDALRSRLAAKNRHNAGTIGAVLLLRSIGFFAGLLLVAVAVDLWAQFGEFAIAGALITVPLVLTVYTALLERAVLGFRPLTPQFCSIYDSYFWHHERLWKFYITPLLRGTPFQSAIWRLAGLRIGRRVFDDGCVIPEKSLVRIGDDAVLNAGSVIQCHSLEDGYFQSGYTSIGIAASLGIKSFVHYGVTIGDGAVLDADAFVLKGEEIGPHAHWYGNPASAWTGPTVRSPWNAFTTADR